MSRSSLLIETSAVNDARSLSSARILNFQLKHPSRMAHRRGMSPLQPTVRRHVNREWDDRPLGSLGVTQRGSPLPFPPLSAASPAR